mmetsp:Transcript_4141/g.6238  ORF Transcript_4141/g.6238 Transcript_4141/m.6238 type:complete len:227 (-) Transcript_4141:789-1469(-)
MPNWRSHSCQCINFCPFKINQTTKFIRFDTIMLIDKNTNSTGAVKKVWARYTCQFCNICKIDRKRFIPNWIELIFDIVSGVLVLTKRKHIIIGEHLYLHIRIRVSNRISIHDVSCFDDRQLEGFWIMCQLTRNCANTCFTTKTSHTVCAQNCLHIDGIIMERIDGKLLHFRNGYHTGLWFNRCCIVIRYDFGIIDNRSVHCYFLGMQFGKVKTKFAWCKLDHRTNT